MRVFILFFSSIVISSSLYAQADFCGVALGSSLAIVKRPALSRYFSAVADSLRLKKQSGIQPQYGFNGYWLIRKRREEIQVGIALGYTQNKLLSDETESYAIIAQMRDLNISVGGNFFIKNWYLLGGHVGVNSFSGVVKQIGDIPNSRRVKFAPVNNKSMGISFFVRVQTGFVVPFHKQGYNGIRILGYYDMGTKISFKQCFNYKLKGYEGSGKTNSSSFGLLLQIAIGKEKV